MTAIQDDGKADLQTRTTDDDRLNVPRDLMPRLLVAGSRMVPGPSFAFAAETNRRLTNRDREEIRTALLQIPVVDKNPDEDQVVGS